jgi:hypothetical protein
MNSSLLSSTDSSLREYQHSDFCAPNFCSLLQDTAVTALQRGIRAIVIGLGPAMPHIWQRSFVHGLDVLLGPLLKIGGRWSLRTGPSSTACGRSVHERSQNLYRVS